MRAGFMPVQHKGDLAVAFAAAGTGVAVSLVIAPGQDGIFGGALAIIMCAIAAIDARHFIIPDELNIAAAILALIAARFGVEGSNSDLAWAVVRGATFALVFLGLRAVYRSFRKKQGVGLGDVKLAGVAGLWLDWQAAAMAIEIAALGALIGYAIHCYMRERTLRASAHLPFGLFFAPAIWLGWLLDTIRFPLP